MSHTKCQLDKTLLNQKLMTLLLYTQDNSSVQYRAQQQLLHYFKCFPSFTELEFLAGFT
jgi:hypothetical protein